MTARRDRGREIERWLVVLIALHSLAAGLVLGLAPAAAARLAGFAPVTPVFFARQAGVFHLVLGLAYLTEHLSYRGVRILVTAKLCALAFLLAATALDDVPWSVPLLGVADGLMGVVVLLVHRRAAAGAAGDATASVAVR